MHAALDLVDLFPKCTVIFTWIPGKLNCADPLTKFLPDPIGICNSDEWRSGYPFMRTVENNRANTYLTVSSSGVKYLGIPDEITKTEKNAQRLKMATAGDNFDKDNTCLANIRCVLCGQDPTS